LNILIHIYILLGFIIKYAAHSEKINSLIVALGSLSNTNARRYRLTAVLGGKEYERYCSIFEIKHTFNKLGVFFTADGIPFIPNKSLTLISEVFIEDLHLECSLYLTFNHRTRTCTVYDVFLDYDSDINTTNVSSSKRNPSDFLLFSGQSIRVASVNQKTKLLTLHF